MLPTGIPRAVAVGTSTPAAQLLMTFSPILQHPSLQRQSGQSGGTADHSGYGHSTAEKFIAVVWEFAGPDFGLAKIMHQLQAAFQYGAGEKDFGF